MTELYDLEGGNWANSEVIRIFAGSLFGTDASSNCAAVDGQNPPDAVVSPLVPTSVTKDEDGEVTVELKDKTDEAKKTALLRAEFAKEAVRTELLGLSKEAARSGNIKAAYLIERAVAELDELASETINETE